MQMWRKRLIRAPFAVPASHEPLPMISFLRDLLSRPGRARAVTVMEPDTARAPRQYELRPGMLLYIGTGAVLLIAAVLVAAAVLTPVRGLIFGPGAEELRAEAQRSAARADALEAEMAAQDVQVAHLRTLITGTPADSSARSPGGRVDAPGPVGPDGQSQPSVAEPLEAGSAAPASRPAPAAARRHLRAPAPLPLDGVVSRGFSEARGHFGLDLAADIGTPVLSAGAGTVVFADQTRDGGLTIAVQQAGGYLSIYKHNSRLLRQAGDRVAARQALALSGNTGVITSGPHLHVEVWRDGRPVDPATVFGIR